MQPRFDFDVSPALNLVRISMGGFFEPDDIKRFRTAMIRAHGQLICDLNQHITLLEIGEMRIQSQAAVAAFGQVLSDPRYISRRLAIVVAKSLARMQMQRAAAGRAARYFEDVEAAECWLLEEPTVLPSTGASSRREISYVR